MQLTIAKEFDFDAAHWLPYVPEGHKCRRMHGHTYRVQVIIESSGPLDSRGMVLDYAEIAAAWGALHDTLDHRLLNEIPGLENPTTEMLAPYILRRLVEQLPGVSAVRVFESSTTWCEVRR